VARKTFVKRMKTKWGGCNPFTGYIHLNTELAKKPPECLEYVVLHELAHLRERTHSAEFFALLDRGMPRWRDVRRHAERPAIDCHNQARDRQPRPWFSVGKPGVFGYT
jgi:predicted metal-dependent hydrolase